MIISSVFYKLGLFSFIDRKCLDVLRYDTQRRYSRVFVDNYSRSDYAVRPDRRKIANYRAALLAVGHYALLFLTNRNARRELSPVAYDRAANDIGIIQMRAIENNAAYHL